MTAWLKAFFGEGDVIVIFVWLMIAVAILANIGDLAPTRGRVSRALPPSAWPSVILTLQIALASLVLVQRAVTTRLASQTEGTMGEPTHARAPLWPLARVATVLVLSLAYLFALPRAGYIIATTLLIAAIMVLFWVRSPVTIVAVSVCATVLLYLIFVNVLLVPLPQGLLRF